MKASLKLREDHHHPHHHKSPLFRLKIPLTILNLPFISSITAGDPTDLSFNLRTNSLSGPSLKLSYSPTTFASTTTSPSSSAFSLSLKSGVGLFGSPNNSPLIISANFNLFSNPNPNPTFSIQIKPQFGDFFLSKTAVSTSLPNPNPNPPKENGEIHHNVIEVMRDFDVGPRADHGVFSGVGVMAKTVLPVAKHAMVKFRWGVNFTTGSDDKLQLPILTVDKISLERVQAGAATSEPPPVPHGSIGNNGSNNGNVRDLELLKGMCSWMRREVDVLQNENAVIKERLDEMKLGNLGRIRASNVGRKVAPLSPISENSEFERWKSKNSGVEETAGRDERWRSKKSGVEEAGKDDRWSKKSGVEETAVRDGKKFGGSDTQVNDVGEELKRAIQAATAAS